MPIIYATIFNGSTLLCDYAAAPGNYAQIARVVIQKMNPNESKMTYSIRDHSFHYMTVNGVTFICATDKQYEKRVPFSFLNDIQERFSTLYGSELSGKAEFSLNESFQSTLKSQIDYFNSGNDHDNIQHVQGQVDEVKATMTENIELLFERGEKMNSILGKTESMKAEAFQFKSDAKTLKTTLCRRRCKYITCVFIFVLVAVAAIVIPVCGGFDFHNCKKKM